MDNWTIKHLSFLEISLAFRSSRPYASPITRLRVPRMNSNDELRRKYVEDAVIANTVYKMTGTDAFLKAFEWFTKYTPICLPLCCDCIGGQSHSIPAHSYEVFYEEATFLGRCPWQK